MAGVRVGVGGALNPLGGHCERQVRPVGYAQQSPVERGRRVYGIHHLRWAAPALARALLEQAERVVVVGGTEKAQVAQAGLLDGGGDRDHPTPLRHAQVGTDPHDRHRVGDLAGIPRRGRAVAEATGVHPAAGSSVAPASATNPPTARSGTAATTTAVFAQPVIAAAENAAAARQAGDLHESHARHRGGAMRSPTRPPSRPLRAPSWGRETGRGGDRLGRPRSPGNDAPDPGARRPRESTAMSMHTLAGTLADLAGLAAPLPTPAPSPPPGLGELGETFISWMTWILRICGVAGLMACGVMMAVGRRNRSAMAADGAAGIPWVLGGLTLGAISALIVAFILPD